MTEKSDGLITLRDILFEKYQKELDLPLSTILRAGEILDEAVEVGFARSRCYRTLLAATVLIACREENVPRVADDFSTVTYKKDEPIAAQKIAKESRKIKRELQLSVLPTKPEQYLEYYADQLSVTEETREKALELLDIAQERDIDQGPAPTTLAAGALDAARRLTNDDIVQSDIAEVSHVSIAQFREYCHKLQEPPEQAA